METLVGLVVGLVGSGKHLLWTKSSNGAQMGRNPRIGGRNPNPNFNPTRAVVSIPTTSPWPGMVRVAENMLKLDHLTLTSLGLNLW